MLSELHGAAVVSVGQAFAPDATAVALRANARAVRAAGGVSRILDTATPRIIDEKEADFVDLRDLETHTTGRCHALVYLENDQSESRHPPVSGTAYAVVGTSEQAACLTPDQLESYAGFFTLSHAATAALAQRTERVSWIGQAFELPETSWASRHVLGVTDDRPLVVVIRPAGLDADLTGFETLVQTIVAGCAAQATIAVLVSNDVPDPLSAELRRSAVRMPHADDEFMAASLLNAADCVVTCDMVPGENWLCGIAAAFGVPVVALSTGEQAQGYLAQGVSSDCDLLGISRVAVDNVVGTVNESLDAPADLHLRLRRRAHAMDHYSMAAVGQRILHSLQGHRGSTGAIPSETHTKPDRGINHVTV